MRTIVALTVLFTAALPITIRGAEGSDAEIEQAVMAVLDEFMRTFNARDATAHVTTYHFPHYRLARGTMSTWESEEAIIPELEETFRNLPESGWNRSVWVHRRIVTLSESKVHVDTRFRRLREDGSEIGTYDSLYILTFSNGRWGIKMRSSYL